MTTANTFSSSISGVNLNPTYLGKCKGTTKAGTPCKHVVVFANGLCKQHGGATPPDYAKAILELAQEKMAKQKARTERRIAKLQRKVRAWQADR